MSKPPSHLQKQFSAAPVITKPPPEDDDVLATLMKYEKEVKNEKKRKPEDSKSGETLPLPPLVLHPPPLATVLIQDILG